MLDGRGNAREQAAAGDRSQHQVNVRQSLHDLQAAGPLSGDDLFVVIRRNDDVAVLANELLGNREPLARGQTHIHHLSAERQRGRALDGRRVRRHDNDGFSAHLAGGIGNALSVVAAGVGDDASGNLFAREPEDLVGRAADLESADGLKALGFEVDSLTGSIARGAGKCGCD